MLDDDPARPDRGRLDMRVQRRMSCAPVRPCGSTRPGSGSSPPPPGQGPLGGASATTTRFARDLVARGRERSRSDGGALGRGWDVEGDPHARPRSSALWAYVAEVVAAYTELTAAEAYLGTAADWTDLRRARRARRLPARGRPWRRRAGSASTVDKGADPLLPAGTRVQAPGTPRAGRRRPSRSPRTRSCARTGTS